MAKILQGKVKWLVLAVAVVAAAVGGYMYYNSQQEAAKANINADLVETQRQSLKSPPDGRLSGHFAAAKVPPRGW